MQSFDVIVVGVGGMGAATCVHLAQRGARVLGLEQFDIPHALGSSHGGSRVFRMCYHEDQRYVPLLQRAFDLWNQLDEEHDSTIFRASGGLFMARPGNSFVGGILAMAFMGFTGVGSNIQKALTGDAVDSPVQVEGTGEVQP